MKKKTYKKPTAKQIKLASTEVYDLGATTHKIKSNIDDGVIEIKHRGDTTGKKNPKDRFQMTLTRAGEVMELPTQPDLDTARNQAKEAFASRSYLMLGALKDTLSKRKTVPEATAHALQGVDKPVRKKRSKRGLYL